MRRRGRTYMVGVASTAGVLAFAIAPAAGMASTSTGSTTGLISCTGKLTTKASANDMQLGVIPTQGKQLGTIHCKQGLGKGRQQNKFKTNLNTGNLTGSFAVKFKNGTVKGNFKLIPQEGSSVGSFGAVKYVGTLKFKSGTGVFAGVKGTGTLIESSKDGFHFKVGEKVKL